MQTGPGTAPKKKTLNAEKGISVSLDYYNLQIIRYEALISLYDDILTKVGNQKRKSKLISIVNNQRSFCTKRLSQIQNAPRILDSIAKQAGSKANINYIPKTDINYKPPPKPIP